MQSLSSAFDASSRRPTPYCGQNAERNPSESFNYCEKTALKAERIEARSTARESRVALLLQRSAHCSRLVQQLSCHGCYGQPCRLAQASQSDAKQERWPGCPCAHHSAMERGGGWR